MGVAVTVVAFALFSDGLADFGRLRFRSRSDSISELEPETLLALYCDSDTDSDSSLRSHTMSRFTKNRNTDSSIACCQVTGGDTYRVQFRDSLQPLHAKCVLGCDPVSRKQCAPEAALLCKGSERLDPPR